MTSKLVFTLIFLSVLTLSEQQSSSCRQARTCNVCQENPNCGWCATTYVCVDGTVVGPTVGSCPNWLWFGCMSEPRNSTTTLALTTRPWTHPITNSTTRHHFTSLPTNPPTNQPTNSQTHPLSNLPTNPTTNLPLNPSTNLPTNPPTNPPANPTTSSAPTPPPHIDPQGTNWWTAFGGDAAHTGFKNEAIGNTISLIETWIAKGDGTLSFPVIYNGVVYVTSAAGTIYFFQENSGEKLNFINIGTYLNVGPPTIGSNEVLYVESIASYSYDINLFGVNVNPFSIKIESSFGLSEWSQNPYGVSTSGLYNLIFYPGSLVNDGTLDSMIYAMSSVSPFQAVYSSSFPSTVDDPGNLALTVYQDTRVFFSTQPGKITSGMFGEIDGSNGNIKWTFTLNSFSGGYATYWIPVIANEKLYAVNNTGNLASILAVDINIHTPVWVSSSSCTTLNNSDVTPATDGLQVFLTCNGSVNAYDALYGKLVATYSPCSFCYGQPIITLDYLFVTSYTGIYVFERITQALLGVIPLPNGKIAYHGGWLFVTSESTLHAFQLLTSVQIE